jgi:hypothetical protein
LTEASPYAVVEEFKPEYAILYDSSIWGQKSATTDRWDETVNVYRKIREKMESLCSAKGFFVERIKDEFYGNVEIYRINWDK